MPPIVVAFLSNRSCIPLFRSCVPFYRSCVPSTIWKPAQIGAFRGVNSPLPFFYLISTVASLWITWLKARGTPAGFPHALAGAAPPPREKVALRACFSFGLDFPGISVLLYIWCASRCAAWCHLAVVFGLRPARVRFAPILTRSVLAFGCAPHAASGLALAPLPASRWPLGSTDTHRKYRSNQNRSVTEKRRRRAGFLRAVPFFQRQKEKS